MPTLSLKQRLDKWSIPEPNSGCHLWLANINHRGYGMLYWEGKMHTAHRLAWISAHGKIDAGLHVCHRCDVRACVNSDHLWLGTNAENMADRDRKGRGADRHGLRNGRAKLTPEQVIAIRSDNRIHRLVAADYGVSKSLIGMIKAGQTWRVGAFVKVRELVEAMI